MRFVVVRYVRGWGVIRELLTTMLLDQISLLHVGGWQSHFRGPTLGVGPLGS